MESGKWRGGRARYVRAWGIRTGWRRPCRQATKFFSITSFFSGFKNNLIGMVGFVTTRRLVKKNFDERMEYEVSWGLIRYDTIRCDGM